MTLALEQSLAVNPFGKKIEVDKKPEDMREVKITIDEAVERMIESYNKKTLDTLSVVEDMDKYFDGLKVETLAPEQIELVLAKITKQALREPARNKGAGIFLSRLIQQSYDGGHNDFILTTNDLMLHHFGWGIKGTQEKPTQMTVHGNVGYGCGFGSDDCLYIINGDVGDSCGSYSTHSTYIIKVDSEHLCVDELKNRTRIICKRSSSYIEGLQGNLYRTQDAKLYHQLVEEETSYGSTIQLLDDKGKIIMETKE